MRASFPLVGLLEDGVLPGEERAFPVSVLGKATVAALAELAGKSVVVVTVTSPVELPSLVAQRWATEALVVSASAEEAALRGLRRVQILAAVGREGAFTAEVLATSEPAPKVQDLTRGARAVLDAIDAGAAPDLPEWEQRLGSALLGLVRALGATEGLADAQRRPTAGALAALARTLAARTPAVKASQALEGALREIAEKTGGGDKAVKVEIPAAMKQRLWSQVVEIQKRLDVYDPGVGKEGDDLGLLQRRLMQAGMPKVARETAKRELRLLKGMSTSHHDHATYYAHLDFMARLPWQPDPIAPIDLDGVAAALERDHFGLGKAKQRVLEYLAVRALGGESASMTLCLSGPPGVGKTSIARSIAQALGRRFVRVPLGGVHDEGEIRGHRLSFVAASAGRVLRGLAQAGSASAVMLLDEVDKIGTDTQRSPAAALLEVLDPEQNEHFQDNFLGVPFDLSHVLFIATANEVGAMHPTLRDRMEPIEIEGYTTQEKAQIAEIHLMPRVAREVGLPEAPPFAEGALVELIEHHTREAGVRQLKRTIGSVYRARALALVRSRTAAAPAQPAEGAPAQASAAEEKTREGTTATAGREGAPAQASAAEEKTREGTTATAGSEGAPAQAPAAEEKGRERAPSPVTKEEIAEVLGPAPFVRRALPEEAAVGVAVGLSVGADGGAILFLEVGLSPGKGRLKLTGRLGEVMRESVQTALSYARMHAARLGIRAERLACDVHLHAPEGAVPKDGPSAGIAVLTALVSAFRGAAPLAGVALTGEMSLAGHVLRVGGVRAKLLAAERAGVKRVVLPADNLPDVPPDLKIAVVPVRSVEEALSAAFDGAG
jgi:ATP-dependent Lon protease